MPYIGNSQVAGVHRNNFKILDDISSYTETFDGSSSSVVNTTNNTITVSQHRFFHGQRVTYNNGGGSNIGGLTSGTVYYAIADSHQTIQLAASLADALSNTAINLSSVGSGTSHTLNNSFDGVNTKFKLTHSGGVGVNLTNASHATVAINNVVQRPNLNDISFTEGFAIEGGKNIVFKVAPSPTDTFWGNTIAESVATFDTTLHTVDSFTADGVTTNFILSKEAISVRDIHVTLDGVTQHTTAISLQGNLLIFSTAPANGTAIQVKHMGFVGATTSAVTSFYGRLGNVALQDGDVLRGDGSLISNLSTIGGNTGVDFNDDVKARFGTGNDLEIFHNSNNNSYIKNGGNLFIQSDNGDIYIQAKTNENSILCQDNGGVGLYYDNSLKAQTRDYGFAVYQDLDVDGHTNLDNVSIAGFTTCSDGLFIPDVKELKIGNSATSPDFKIFNNTSATIIREENSDLFIQASHLKIQDTAGNYKLMTNGTGVSIPSGSILDVDGHTNLDNVNIAGVSTFSNPVSVAATAHFASQQFFFGPVLNTGEISIDLLDNGIAATFDHNDTGGLGLFIRTGSDLYLLADHKTNTASNGDGYGLIIKSGSGNIIPSHDYKPQLGLSNREFGTLFADQLNISGISTFASDFYTSGRISIGGENPGHFYSGADNLVVADFSADAGISIFGGGSNKSYIAMGSTTFGTGALEAYIEKTHGNTGPLTIRTQLTGSNIEIKAGNDFVVSNTGTQRLRISSAGITTFYGEDDQDNFTVDAAGGTQFTIHQDATDGEVSIRAQDGSGNNYAKYMTFFTEGGSGPTERLRINSDGSANFTDSLSAANYAGFKAEQGSVDTTSLNGTFNFHLGNGHVRMFTSATAGNYNPNFHNTGSKTINNSMSVGDTVSATLIVASSSHYCTSSIQIDGTTTGVTVEWVGGSAPSAANGSGYDIYAFTIIKTASTPTYTVFANAISAA